MQFHDRRHAGRELAARLRIQQEKGALAHPVVLALPRGGVVVAREVADALEAPLDVLVARTIGAPSREAVGVGALTGEDPRSSTRTPWTGWGSARAPWRTWWHGSGRRRAVARSCTGRAGRLRTCGTTP